MLAHVFPAKSGPPEVGKPKPVNITVSGELAAFDVNTTCAVSAPEAAGVNVPVNVTELSVNTVAVVGLTVNAALSLTTPLITRSAVPALNKDPVAVVDSPGNTSSKLTSPGRPANTGLGFTQFCGNKKSSTLR